MDYKVRDRVFKSITIGRSISRGDMLLVRVTVSVGGRGVISEILAGQELRGLGDVLVTFFKNSFKSEKHSTLVGTN